MPEELNLEGKTLLLVDGSSYLYRAYHAMPDLRGPDGGPTGALYGMINMLRRLRKDINAEYSACVFDAKGKTFRDDWYADYKANRPSMPDDLSKQIEPIHVTVRALGWPLVMIDGVDATGILRQSQKTGVRLQVSADSIAEFRVNAALYQAEYGGVAGGQIDVISRAGSDDWHGSLFEYIRNDRLDARSPFDPSSPPPLRRR